MVQKRDAKGNKVLSAANRRKVKGLKPFKDSSTVKIPVNRSKRRKLILKEIQPRQYFCPGLNAYVVVTSNNIRHYQNQSVKTYESMKALLNIRQVIKKGVLVDFDNPKINKSQKRYSKNYILYCRIKLTTGTEAVKLVVGRHKDYPGKREVYSITSVKVE